ncbi:unnamed protein product [Adineta steineri]|uniref:Phage tail collar domain-containing protein n=1 Tax=Adineta steineri TaxID=433720 RepID=A0A819AK34_9BILA|nr:unnamed protein product [Adineta steineri]CAF3788983.1 unnamed protein product [Adineta steineri]
MVVRYTQNPRLSEWDMPEHDEFQNRNIICRSAADVSIDADRSESSDLETKKPKSTCKCANYCESNMSPFLKGIIVGVAMNILTLIVVLLLWLVPRHYAGIVVTNELPPGTILLYSGNLTILNGSTFRWLLCDGSEVSRTIYQDLFEAIGVTYGSGNGNDTFNIPDFRSRFPLGSNSTYSNSLVAGGTSLHFMSIAELPIHSHTQGSLQTLYSGVHTHAIVDPGHNHGGSTGAGPFSGGSFSMNNGGGAGNDGGAHSHSIPAGATGVTMQSDGNHNHTIQGSTDTQGSSQAMDKMPPYQTVHYIIRA